MMLLLLLLLSMAPRWSIVVCFSHFNGNVMINDIIIVIIFLFPRPLSSLQLLSDGIIIVMMMMMGGRFDDCFVAGVVAVL